MQEERKDVPLLLCGFWAFCGYLLSGMVLLSICLARSIILSRHDSTALNALCYYNHHKPAGA
jgi:hypothetical protein